MMQRFGVVTLIVVALLGAVAVAPAESKPEGTLTVAVATFGNERWLPHLYPGAEDVVLKPWGENLLTRDPKTGDLAPMLAERWKVADGGRAWTFYLRKGVQFHGGRGEVTAEDVRFTFAAIAKEGSASSLAPEFRAIKSMEVENPYTLTVRFDKPSVAFGNKVTQGLFASVAFIHSKRHHESVGEQGAERNPVATGPFKFVEHVRGDRIVYEAVENHWRATPQFKRLVFLKVPEPATRMAMLRAGSVDVIEIGGEYVEEAALNLFMEHPKLDEFIDRLAIEPNYKERVRIMRDEMGPWLHEYIPGVAIGAAHAIAGVGPKVAEWPLIPGHMGFHNWEYVTRAR